MSKHTAQDKDPDNPLTTSLAHDLMRPKWDMVETLIGGTAAMRSAGKQYLPQHEEETNHNYKQRLATCTLFNMTELTLDSWVGRPFSDPLKLNEDIPSEVAALLDDIDLEGNSITTVSRWWFKEALGKSVAHILVDMPSLGEEEAFGRTLADDRRDSRRPYWVPIKPENLIYASAEVRDGQEFLTHVRLLESKVTRVGFAEQVEIRVRVLEPGIWQVWKPKNPEKRDTQWVLEEAGTTSLNKIPLVSFYTNRDGLMHGKPPIEDLATLNIRHWQSTSDQTNIITVARFPMLSVAGAVDVSGTSIKIGPRNLLGTRDPNGRFYYVEHKGAAIEAGRQDLMDIEEQMSNYGAEFLKRRPGTATATARALDSAESLSPLQDSTLRFMDAIGTALNLTAEWMGLGVKKGGTVRLATDFGPEKVKTIDFRTLLETRRNRDMSREEFLMELKRRGQLSDEFDIAVNLKNLKSEPEILSPFATGANTKKPGSGAGVGRPPKEGGGPSKAPKGD